MNSSCTQSVLILFTSILTNTCEGYTDLHAHKFHLNPRWPAATL